MTIPYACAESSHHRYAYQDAMAKKFQVKHVFAVRDGYTATGLVLRGMGLEAGDEVLVPSFAYADAVLPLLKIGITPLPVDTYPDATPLPLIDHALQLAGPKTKAFLSVPMWGQSQKERQLVEAFAPRNIPVISDMTRAIGINGLQYGFGYEGTHGLAGFFSTHENTILSTGEGGIVMTNDDTLAEKIVSYLDAGFPNSLKQQLSTSYDLRLPQLAAQNGLLSLANLDATIRNNHFISSNIDSLMPNLHKGINPYALAQGPLTNNDAELYYLTHETVETITAETLNDRLAALHLWPDFTTNKLTLLTEYDAIQQAIPFDRDKTANRDLPNAHMLKKHLLVIPTRPPANRQNLLQFMNAMRDMLPSFDPVATEAHRRGLRTEGLNPAP